MEDGEMPDDANTNDAQAGKVEDKSTAQGDGEEFDKDRALATIRKLRENEKATKAQLKELADLKAKQAEIDAASMTEKEKAEARATQAEQEREAARAEARQLKTERAIEKAAAKKGIDPDLAASLLKPESLELDDKGHPTGIEEALDALLKKWPHLKAQDKPAPPNVNATSGGKQAADPAEKLSDIRRRYRLGNG